MYLRRGQYGRCKVVVGQYGRNMLRVADKMKSESLEIWMEWPTYPYSIQQVTRPGTSLNCYMKRPDMGDENPTPPVHHYPSS